MGFSSKEKDNQLAFVKTILDPILGTPWWGNVKIVVQGGKIVLGYIEQTIKPENDVKTPSQTTQTTSIPYQV